MFPKPVPSLATNTYAYESAPMVKPTGFREYDARWLFEKEINLMGVQALGLGLGTLLHEMGVKPELATGHDFRSYSASIKYALVTGLMAAGVKVKDIGLALSPMAYFAQFALDTPAVAMITASHNDNGWTGVKMGAQRPVTFGPDGKTLFRRMPAIADRPDNFAISAHLAPNMQVIARSDNVHPLVMWPVTPTTSRTIVYNLFPAEFAAEPGFKEKAQVYHDYISLVLSEDRDMVASLQRAMSSSFFDPGRMSFLEKGIHHVLNAYLGRVLD